jgi:hypothetical protein
MLLFHFQGGNFLAITVDYDSSHIKLRLKEVRLTNLCEGHRSAT